jgi:outer membrane lipoprotein-sorting protein
MFYKLRLVERMPLTQCGIARVSNGWREKLRHLFAAACVLDFRSDSMATRKGKMMLNFSDDKCKVEAGNKRNSLGRRLLLLTLLIFGLLPSSMASAGGAQTLAKVDAALNRYKRIHYRYAIVTTREGGMKSKIDVEVWMKRAKKITKSNKQFTEIHNGALKGTLILTTSDNEMLMYMPAFRRTRRIGTSDQSASFLDTALTPGIMNLTRYGKFYRVDNESKAGNKTVLKLSATSPKAPFPGIRLTVNKAYRPVLIEYTNAAGKVIISERREKYSACKKDYCTAKRMTVRDHRSNVKSVLKMKKYKINGKLRRNGKSVRFSRRDLI